MKFKLAAFVAASAMTCLAAAQDTVSAACSVETVFVPVTSVSTMTVYSPCPQDPTTTVTSTSVRHKTVTVTATESTGGSYYYAVDAGSTSPILASPLASMPSVTVVTVQSTITDYDTYTPPPYISTHYSYVGPPITLTSTSTFYSTISVVPALSTSAARTASSFSGVGPEGWNSTSTSSEASPASDISTGQSSVGTITQSYFSATGAPITSTSTTHITTTLHVTDLTTVTRTSESVTLTRSGSEVSPEQTSLSSSISSISSSSKSLASGGSSGFPSLLPSSSGLYPNSSVATVTQQPSSPFQSSYHGTGYAYTPSSFHTSLSLTLGSNSSTADAVSNTRNISTTVSPVEFSTSPISSASFGSGSQSTLSSIRSSSNSSVSGIPTSLAPYAPPQRSLTSIVLPTSSTVTGKNASVISSTAGPIRTSDSSSLPSSSTTSVVSLSASSYISLPSGIGTELPSVSQSISHQQSSSVPASRHPSSSMTSGSVPTPSTNASLSSTASSQVSSASESATPTACGEHGFFTLSFDDLPSFTPSGQNQTDITKSPPVFSPYHHLSFSGGYVYAPSSREPYTPHSTPNVAAFLPSGAGMTASSIQRGEIADGPYESSSAFWFDALSVWLGCDSHGPAECTVKITAYVWSPSAKDEVEAFSQNATIPPCSTSSGCQLHQVEFPETFRNLTGVQMQAYVGNEERMFFVDDVALSWSNNTCAAGLLRLQYQ